MKNNKGFTLIELLVVIAIVGIFVAIVAGKIKGFDKELAEQSMRNYVQTINPGLRDVTAICSNKDSDNNGYVRCTGAGTNSKEERITIVAECDEDGNCVPIQGVDR